MQRDWSSGAAGRHDAFTRLVDDSIDRLYAVASLILRDRDRAQDAVQEALVSAWKDVRSLRDPDAWDAWLYRLTVWACYRSARRDRRRTVVELRALPDPVPAVVDHPALVAERDRLERGSAVCPSNSGRSSSSTSISTSRSAKRPASSISPSGRPSRACIVASRRSARPSAEAGTELRRSGSGRHERRAHPRARPREPAPRGRAAARARPAPRSHPFHHGPARPRPRWLALIKEPPMRLPSLGRRRFADGPARDGTAHLDAAGRPWPQRGCRRDVAADEPASHPSHHRPHRGRWRGRHPRRRCRRLGHPQADDRSRHGHQPGVLARRGVAGVLVDASGRRWAAARRHATRTARTRARSRPRPGWLFQTSIIGTPNISWSPDGERIATVVSREHGHHDRARGNRHADTHPARHRGPGCHLRRLVSRRAVARVRRTMGRRRGLPNSTPDGTEEHSISPVADDAPSYLSVDWSPDSGRVTYARKAAADPGYSVSTAEVEPRRRPLSRAAPAGLTTGGRPTPRMGPASPQAAAPPQGRRSTWAGPTARVGTRWTSRSPSPPRTLPGHRTGRRSSSSQTTSSQSCSSQSMTRARRSRFQREAVPAPRAGNAYLD